MCIIEHILQKCEFLTWNNLDTESVFHLPLPFQGLVSLKRKWQMKYGFGIKIIPSQKLAFLQYVFYDTHGEEIDMKEEIEIK